MDATFNGTGASVAHVQPTDGEILNVFLYGQGTALCLEPGASVFSPGDTVLDEGEFGGGTGTYLGTFTPNGSGVSYPVVKTETG
jgi:hypothetical protein